MPLPWASKCASAEKSLPAFASIRAILCFFCVYEISQDFKDHAWQNAAFIAGCADAAGSIEPGKIADIAVFESDPYEDTDCGLPSEKAVMTVFNGKIVYQRSNADA